MVNIKKEAVDSIILQYEHTNGDRKFIKSIIDKLIEDIHLQLAKSFDSKQFGGNWDEVSGYNQRDDEINTIINSLK